MVWVYRLLGIKFSNISLFVILTNLKIKQEEKFSDTYSIFVIRFFLAKYRNSFISPLNVKSFVMKQKISIVNRSMQYLMLDHTQIYCVIKIYATF